MTQSQFELDALNWPADRNAILALDTSYSADRLLCLELTSRSAALVERQLPTSVRRSYRLEEILDSLPDYDWVRVVRDSGVIIGLAAIAWERWNRRARLEHLYVAHAFRHRGIGTALVNGAVEAARWLEARGVWVETQTTNYAAVQFYERCGFRWCGLDASLYDASAAVSAEAGLFLWRPVDQREP